MVLISLLAEPCFSQELSIKAKQTTKPIEWPVVRGPEKRPWTWWWWHGSAADTFNISRTLKSFSKTGLGGVNLVFILDVKDSLAPKVEFLSKKWVELVTFTVGKARKLGMDVDMAPVSGWAFGGPSIGRRDAASELILRKFDGDFIRRGEFLYDTTYGGEFRFEDIEAVLAVSDNGERILVTDKLKRRGIIDWKVPEGNWTFYATVNHPGSSMVRFPSADQRGFAMDHLNNKVVNEYFSQFTKAFSGYEKEYLPRAYNVDSWEVSLNWTRGFYDEFRKRRGYDLRWFLPELFGYAPDEKASRVMCDYRETLSDLMIENFNKNFRQWTHEMGGLAIGEIYSEPSNVLDANAVLDIPQLDVGGRLESFVRNGKYYTDWFDNKCASSAAHILGKPLVSSETFTCMGPVFDTPFDVCKQKLDWDFVSDVNQSCFHGITYSPQSAGWPGWLFYAGTHLGDFNPLWQLSGSQLCTYITRVQSFMQMGRSDKDLLFYFPYYDKFSRIDSDPGRPPRWWTSLATGDYPAATKLMESGCDFDFVSDKMLKDVIKGSQGMIGSDAKKYKALVIADCHLLPASTLRRIIDLAGGGSTVIMAGNLPEDVPGMYRLSERQKEFSELISYVRSSATVVRNGISVKNEGTGRIIFGKDILSILDYAGIKRESLVDDSLQYTRRRDDDGWIYFVVNPSGRKSISKWIPFSVKGSCAALFDPMSGKKGMATMRNDHGISSVFMQLESNQSMIVKIYDRKVTGEKWMYYSQTGAPVRINGKWEVSFIAGGEKIPHPEEITGLTSWTEWKSDQAELLRGFSGTARYKIVFEKPAAGTDGYYLSLGEVCHSARVLLNGKDLGTLFAYPMQLDCGKELKEGENTLEVEVANTAINRVAWLDQHNISWYHETSGMDLSSCDYEYKKKDESWVPVRSGLIGPVELIPVSFIDPSRKK